MELQDVNDFGSFLRYTRKKYGITQAFLSKESGVTRAIISNLENHKTKNTLLSTAIKLSNALKRGVFMQEVKK